MIQILELEIEEFRGIRHLKLNFDGKSFAVHGPNGSGKSGVVDAIGFGLTGTIARRRVLVRLASRCRSTDPMCISGMIPQRRG